MVEQALGSGAEGLGDEELLTPAGTNLLPCPGPPLQVDLELLLHQRLCSEELQTGHLEEHLPNLSRETSLPVSSLSIGPEGLSEETAWPQWRGLCVPVL